MIEAFYALKKKPFQKDIPAKDIFLSEQAHELRRRLDYIKENRGIMLITGMPGTGKTLHIRAFTQALNPNLYKCLYTPLSTVNILDFYRQLSVNLGGEGYWRKSQLFSSIQNSIQHYVRNHKKIPVILFDEAHLLKNENFYELQIITNFNMDSTDPALVILIGQPHLRERLLRPIHQAFNQRVSLKFHLPPLTDNETGAYLQHHLNLAGLDQPLFNPNAVKAIHQNSGGIPRVINALAINSMTIGALEKKDTLTEEEVYRASREL